MSSTLDSLDFGFKTFRDCVHKDIEFSELEVAVIDTARFQRLRSTQQLGTTSLVFPSAEHSRFTHALGTVHVAELMLRSLERQGHEITPDRRRLVRLCALLHDIGHVPYGHTLEDEAHLLPGPLGHGSQRTFERLIAESEIGETVAQNTSPTLVQEIVATLSAKGEDEIAALDAPWAADIVSNTLCADLLDYLDRDTFHCGLPGSYDKRILKYLTIQPYHGAQRLVLQLMKRGEIRRDVINELIGLVRLRYDLAQKVYYHHTKMFTSGMVAAAVHAALRAESKVGPEARELLEEFGDESLLRWLANHTSSTAARTVGAALLHRRKFRAAYKLSYRERRLGPGRAEEIREWADTYNGQPSQRWQMERTLEMYNELPEGSIVIYCPSPNMQRKVAQTLVLWREGRDGADPEITPFCDVPDDEIVGKVSDIVKDHERLWKAYVLVDSAEVKKNPDVVRCLASDCEREFGLLNDFEGLSNLRLPVWIERRVDGWDQAQSKHITYAERTALAARLPRPSSEESSDSASRMPSDRELEEALEALRRETLL